MVHIDPNHPLSDKNLKVVAFSQSMIDEILASLPEFMSAGEMDRADLTSEWRERLRKELAMVRIREDKLTEFFERLYQNFWEGRPVPGTPLGSSAATAHSATTTQVALDVFHKSGAESHTETTIKQMERIIKVRGNQGQIRCNVFFDRDLSEDEIRKAQMDMEEIRGTSFIRAKDIEIIRYSKSLYKDYWWAWLYDHPRYVKRGMRVHFDLDKMARKQVTVQDFVLMLTRTGNRSGLGSYSDAQQEAIVSSLKIIPAPTLLGFVDIYVDSPPVVSGDGETSHILIGEGDNKIPITTDYILANVIEPAFDTVISGIPGCIFTEAKKYDLEDLLQGQQAVANTFPRQEVASMERLAEDFKRRNYSSPRPTDILPNDTVLFFSKTKHKIPFEEDKFVRMLGQMDITVHVMDKTYAIVSGPKALNRIRESDVDKTFCRYIASIGDTLPEILLQKDVSHRYSTTTNMVTNNKLFGIDNAGRAMAERIQDTMSQGGGSIINPSHILLVSQVFTVRGVIAGSTSSNLSSTDIVGPMTLAAFDNPQNFIQAAATESRSEKMNNVVPCLMGAVPVKQGTGYSHVGVITNGGNLYIDEDVYDTTISEVHDLLHDVKEIALPDATKDIINIVKKQKEYERKMADILREQDRQNNPEEEIMEWEDME